jgi:chemotaxis signal transduction protein
LKLAQGILCGPWALAFPFEWARQIVDSFELSPIPKAPLWLLGATNVDGNILPVVDLHAYLHQTAPASMHHPRVLIGGLPQASDGADSTGDAIAIVFAGLPQQLSYEPRPITYASALPQRLRAICRAVASAPSGSEYLEIDTDRLVAALSDELALA